MEIKKIRLLVELEEALIDLHDSKSISDETFYKQLIPIICDYIEGDEVELAVIVMQQVDYAFLQKLKRYKGTEGTWERQAHVVYEELGLAYCKVAFSEVLN